MSRCLVAEQTAVLRLGFLLSFAAVFGCEPSSSSVAPSTVDPHRVARALEHAKGLRQAGQRSQAIRVLEEVRGAGGILKLEETLAAYYLEEEDYDSAASAADRALALDAESPRALRTRGLAAVRRGWDEEGVTYLQRAVSKAPTPDSLALLGESNLRLERLDDAKSAFEKALALEPRMASSHYGLGVVAMRREKLSEAEKHFRTTLQLRPDDSKAAFNLGNVLMRSGQREKAERLLLSFREREQQLEHIRRLKEAVESEPRNTAYLVALAEALVQSGDLESGVGAYLRALEIDPVHKKALGALVALAKRYGFRDDARRMLSAAAKRSPGDPYVESLRRQLEAP